jgi:hypothetical protein
MINLTKLFWAGTIAAMLCGGVAIAQDDTASDAQADTWYGSRMMMGPSAQCPLGGTAPGMADRYMMRQRAGMGSGNMGGGMMHGGGMMGGGMMGGGMMGGMENSLLSVAAEELGMTSSELVAELSDGKTIAQVAGERGVDPQTIADAYMAERSAWLADLVAEGRLTQEQADAMLDHMAEEIVEHMDESMPMGGGPGDCWGDDSGETWQGGPHMRPGGGMRGFPGGGMQGVPGQSDA